MEQGVYRQFYELEKDQWWFAGMRLICRTVLERQYDGVWPDSFRCLDVGCATGLWTKELGRFGSAWGLDCSPDALAFCRQRGEEGGDDPAGQSLCTPAPVGFRQL